MCWKPERRGNDPASGFAVLEGGASPVGSLQVGEGMSGKTASFCS